MEYYPDIFYDVQKISKKKLVILFQEAKLLSYKWWVDGLLNDNWAREKIDMSFEDVIKLFNKTKKSNLHITFIHRKGFEKWPQYLEIGFSTLSGNSIFLWIDVDIKHKQYLLERYFKEIKTL
jgi:hypothetical protein